MKDILTAPFVEEMKETTANMYRLGWDERNGGNISYMLDEEEVAQYLDLSNVIRTIDTGFDATPLIGKIFIVTGSGKYFKNVTKAPQINLGIVRIAKDGTTAELLWGFEDGGTVTSEFPAHMMSHMARLEVNPANRVVLHAHPTYTLAMNFVHQLDDRAVTRSLWQMCTECMVVFPDGIGVLPWMLCGGNDIGIATAEKMKEYRLVIWGLHGLYGAGKDLDETFGLLETVEKAAQLYMLTAHLPRLYTITDPQLLQIAKAYHVEDICRKDFLDI
ncbi:MAG: rhamnulose-1-phosphate aldolase [Clostridia bacterium]|nr:rhamnulose-1-phosphate aldolase [Clostridia bacterium]